MTKLTNEEKITLLKKMVALLQADKCYFEAGVCGPHFGLCFAFTEAYWPMIEPAVNMLDVIPELLAYKPVPSKDHPYWFDRYDFNARIRICEDAISQLKKCLYDKGGKNNTAA